MLIQFFKQPFPFFQKKWHTVILIALCVFTMLTILDFSLGQTDFLESIFFIAGFTTTSIICSSIVIYLFPMLFKHFFDEKRWTKGTYFASAFILALMIGLVNTLYNYILGVKMYCVNLPFFAYLYRNLSLAFLMGIIPTAVGYFWMKSQGLRSDLQEKEDQNRKLIFRVQEKNVPDEKIITLSGNTKDSLTLFPRELLYIESSGNYIQVYYQINEQISHKTLRATLQQMEELLKDYPFIVRCHRAFLVNIYQIEKIKGFKLWLKSIETEIPISKTYKTNIPNI
ncbi:MAG: LytTR family transcriptional regulator [Dysgonamonadaceae bacterium]|jgi:hypothetical protein|nr:LytTR family transcriptional regulator [Dysgonamonadaceae bacterium]